MTDSVADELVAACDAYRRARLELAAARRRRLDAIANAVRAGWTNDRLATVLELSRGRAGELAWQAVGRRRLRPGEIAVGVLARPGEVPPPGRRDVGGNLTTGEPLAG